MTERTARELNMRHEAFMRSFYEYLNANHAECKSYEHDRFELLDALISKFDRHFETFGQTQEPPCSKPIPTTKIPTAKTPTPSTPLPASSTSVSSEPLEPSAYSD